MSGESGAQRSSAGFHMHTPHTTSVSLGCEEWRGWVRKPTLSRWGGSIIGAEHVVQLGYVAQLGATQNMLLPTGTREPSWTLVNVGISSCTYIVIEEMGGSHKSAIIRLKGHRHPLNLGQPLSACTHTRTLRPRSPSPRQHELPRPSDHSPVHKLLERSRCRPHISV